jgi:di/tricarboxylate transporter
VLLYLATNIMTELLTNVAAAALFVPVSLAVAATLGAEPTPYVLAVALAASAGFTTPLGYQTHLMVMGAGGYRFIDFFRVGLPLNLIVMVVALTAIWVVWL